jgi:L-aspartate oxidase
VKHSSADRSRAPARAPAHERVDAGDAALILGAGLAGLYLALKLAPRRAIVVAPQPAARRTRGGAASAWAQGGIAAALDPDDSPAAHAADTVATGAGLTDPVIARLLAEDAPARVRELAALGVPFDRDAGGGFALSREAAHSRARVARVKGDLAGRAIMRAVGQAAAAAEHVELRLGFAALDLIRDAAGRVAGAFVVGAEGALVEIAARDVVLATGGIGGLYAVTTNPPTARGEGLAMAARAGAVIADPEFVQFHPTALDVGRDPAPLATEALRGEGALIVDREGQPIVDPLAARDLVARAVHAARLHGGGAFLDARMIGEAFPERFPTVFDSCRTAGLDPRRDLIPIAPAAHYHMGGAATDDRGRTTAENLWSIGESASTGAHGANRLASNSLLEALVFGARAAVRLEDAAGTTGPRSAVPPDTRPFRDIKRLRALMARTAGVGRTEEGLAEAEAMLAEMGAARPDSNAPLAARLIVEGARARKESRGAHTRLDHPKKSRTARRTFLVFEDGALRRAEAPFRPSGRAASKRASAASGGRSG